MLNSHIIRLNFTLNHWLERKKNEIKEFYIHKGVVAVIADISPIAFYTYSYRDGHEKIDLLKLFTADEVLLSYEPFNGDEFISDVSIKELFKNGNTSFQFTFSALIPSIKVLATTIKSKHPISLVTKILSGQLLILNSLDYNEEISNQKGFFKWFTDQLINIASQLEANLSEVVKNPPEWISNIKLTNEIKLEEAKTKKEIELEQIKDRLLSINTELTNYHIYKSILYTSGKYLEIGIGKCLEKIGLSHYYPDGSETDLIIRENDVFYAVEIKGITGTASLKNTRQLEDWVGRVSSENEDFIVKGLLIINCYNGIPLGERPLLVFPPNVVEYSVARKHCLITTETLLNILRDFEDKKIDKNKILMLLTNTIGVLEYK